MPIDPAKLHALARAAKELSDMHDELLSGSGEDSVDLPHPSTSSGLDDGKDGSVTILKAKGLDDGKAPGESADDDEKAEEMLGGKDDDQSLVDELLSDRKKYGLRG